MHTPQWSFSRPLAISRGIMAVDEVAVDRTEVAGHAVLIMGRAMAMHHEVVDMAHRVTPSLLFRCFQRNNRVEFFYIVTRCHATKIRRLLLYSLLWFCCWDLAKKKQQSKKPNKTWGILLFLCDCRDCLKFSRFGLA